VFIVLADRRPTARSTIGSGRYQVTTLGMLFTPCASVSKKCHLVPVKGPQRSTAGKMTVFDSGVAPVMRQKLGGL